MLMVIDELIKGEISRVPLTLRDYSLLWFTEVLAKTQPKLNQTKTTEHWSIGFNQFRIVFCDKQACDIPL